MVIVSGECDTYVCTYISLHGLLYGGVSAHFLMKASKNAELGVWHTLSVNTNLRDDNIGAVKLNHHVHVCKR
jgi:hypothetical protein